MKYTLHISLLCLLLLTAGCSNDNAPECFRKMGPVVQYDVVVADPFVNLYVGLGIDLVIQQGTEQRITIQTGSNIKDLISAKVVDGELQLTNATSCNWVNEYNTTTVYLTVPNLEKIYSATQFSIRSQGQLAFPKLSLRSGEERGDTASGTFMMDMQCNDLLIEDNQAAYFVLSGSVTNLTIGFYNGDDRFDGSALIAQSLHIYHCGSNDIIANVQQEVTGTLCSTGNLVLLNHPPTVTVEQLYTGKIIYE